MTDPVPIGKPKPSGGDIPEPFNENDVRAWIGRFLKTLCREDRNCFYPSEFILNEEIEQAKAYDNPKEKEKALYNERNAYYKLAKHCLEELTKMLVLVKDSIRDSADNREYEVYCKTLLLLNTICPKVNNINGLPDIDKILEEYRSRR